VRQVPPDNEERPPGTIPTGAPQASLGGDGSSVAVATTATPDDLLATIEVDPHRLAHSSTATNAELDRAAAEGRLERGYCGFTRVPLRRPDTDGLPVCAVCHDIARLVVAARDLTGWS
jgi:hypothetical protein